MKHNGETTVHMVELLSVTAVATEDDGPVVALAMRPDDNSWRPHNVAISKEQAHRLRDDLNRLFADYSCLAQPIEKDTKE